MLLEEWVILQVPINIFEGDDLHLRCHSWPFATYAVKNIKFYKDKETVPSYNNEIVFAINRGFNNGIYGCTMVLKFAITSKIYEDWTNLSVQELFSHPAIKVSSYQMREGSNMTVSCHTSLNVLRESTVLQTAFYKNAKLVKEFSFSNEHQIIFAQLEDSGDYTCEVTNLPNTVRKMSNSLTIYIQELFSHPAIKVSSYQMREGSNMTVSCHTSLNVLRESTVLQTAFYKNAKLVKEFSFSNEYQIIFAQLEDSGDYTCEVTNLPNTVRKMSNSLTIYIQELFSHPAIKVSSYQMREGSNMTVSCHTSLNVLRESTVLQTAFYKNAKLVKEFSFSNEYQIIFAQLEDSGDYTCEVTNLPNTVRKMSNSLTIYIQELFSHPAIKVSSYQMREGSNMTVSCHTSLNVLRESTVLQTAFYKNAKLVKEFSFSNEYQIIFAQLEDSGDYTCEVTNLPNTVRKMSNSLTIYIQELFSHPAIKVSSYQMREGSNMTVSCHTSLNVLRESTVLQTAFYKNAKLVKEFSFSNEYQIIFAQLEDSGDYTCEVTNLPNTVRKMSNSLTIYIQVEHPSGVTVYLQPRDGLLIEGQRLEVTCSVTKGTGLMEFSWYNQYKKGCQLQQVHSQQHIFVISNITENYDGQYFCAVKRVRSQQQSKSESVRLTVKVEHPSGVTVYLQPRDGLLIEGQRLEVTCSVTKGTGLMEFSWCNQYKRGCQLQQVHSQQHIFVISNITENYDGQYFCAVKRVRSQQQSQSESVRITVKVQVSKPTLMINLSEVAIGDDVDFVCLSDRGSLPIHYQFYHMGMVVRNITVNQKGGAHLRLNIANVKVAGLYYCDSHNDISNSSLSNEVTLSIIVPVAHAMITVKNGTLDVKAQDSMTFNCSVELGTSPNFMWFHNKEEVDERSGLYQITEMGMVLHVKSVQLQHGGTYQCQASNMVSPNRIFTAQSNILTVTVLGVSGTLHGILTPSLSVSLLVLLLICGFLLFNYRRKIAQSINCSFCQQQAGKEIPKSRNHQEHEHEDTHSQGCSVTEDQEEYYNLNPRDVTMNNSVCYTYIDVKCGKKVAVQSDDIKAGYSVTYSAVKCKAKVTTNSACNKELPDPSDSIYENFNSK
ncbi:Fc receptor-like protein 3 isoform X1 [Bombina bombina]|uniref:Fc receptor-like protein 3 isoform X1 n=1 Tax=Bombina bombina TaxID=8345 RepID=UPI00235AB9A9|nr:Fc receptor-like protein 3 isoform X1 [Bombina bombina]